MRRITGRQLFLREHKDDADIVGGRGGLKRQYYELIGDRPAVLGELHDGN